MKRFGPEGGRGRRGWRVGLPLLPRRKLFFWVRLGCQVDHDARVRDKGYRLSSTIRSSWARKWQGGWGATSRVSGLVTETSFLELVPFPPVELMCRIGHLELLQTHTLLSITPERGTQRKKEMKTRMDENYHHLSIAAMAHRLQDLISTIAYARVLSPSDLEAFTLVSLVEWAFSKDALPEKVGLHGRLSSQSSRRMCLPGSSLLRPGFNLRHTSLSVQHAETFCYLSPFTPSSRTHRHTHTHTSKCAGVGDFDRRLLGCGGAGYE
jgi:hypothetical protein